MFLLNYKEISINGLLQEIKSVSTGPHPRKFCFVLGAGASRSSGIKSGRELVDIWDKELQERNKEDYLAWKSECRITDDNKYSFYSQYYEKRFERQPMDGYNCLEKLMEHAHPSAGYVILSYLLSQTKNNVVITTNFDHLTEDAINYYAQTLPLVIGHESLANYISKQLYRPTIIKIHRDLLFNPANTVKEVYELHENWKKVLNHILSEYNPIFIGYAGNDNSLMDYLIEQSKEFADNKLCFPYWMLYGDETPSEKVYEFLEKSNGYFIRHSGFDETMFLIGNALGIKIPPKEVFIKEAEKRYKVLGNTIDKLTDTYLKDRNNNDSSGGSDNSGAIKEISEAVQQVTGQSELQRMYMEVVSLHNEGNYDKALSIERELIQLNPKSARYHNALGITLHAMKRYEEAVEEKQKAIELEPDNARYHNDLGGVLHTMKRYDETFIEMKKAVELEPDNAEYHNSLGVILHEMERYDEAVTEKRKAVELEPDNAEYHNSLDVTLQERYNEVLKECPEASGFKPGALYRNSLNATLHKMERYDEALAEKQKAVEVEA